MKTKVKMKWVTCPDGLKSWNKMWHICMTVDKKFKLIRHTRKRDYDYGDFDTQEEAKEAAESDLFL